MPDPAASEETPGGSPPPPPEVSSAAPPTPPWRPLRPWEWRLLGWLLVLFALRGVPWRLDGGDQARQAYASLEMVQGSQWAFQHLPGGRTASTRPPLVAWTSAALFYLTGGHWEIAWRLPSFLAAVALAALLWRAGERAWPGWGGLLAASAYGFNLLAPRLATLVSTDLPFALWVTGLGLVVWRHVRDGGQPWDPRDRWTVFTLLVLALMTRGLLVYAFLLPGMLVHSWLCRRRGHVGAHPWGGWWHWTLPLLPFLFWLERGMVTMPGFYDLVLGRGPVGRLAAVSAAAPLPPEPVWYYFAQLLACWVPWTVLLLAVRFRARRLWWVMCGEPGGLWLVCWAAGGLLLLSLLPDKQVDRLFPALPPLCLVLTALLARAQRQARDDLGPDAAGAGSMVVPTATDLWPLRWSRWAVGGALLLAVGTTVGGVALTYFMHHTETGFAARVRAATIERGRRVELVVDRHPSPEDEAMLVSLRRLAFLGPAEAIQQASLGQLDAVVLSDKALASAGGPTGLLDPFAPTRPELTNGHSQPAYLLISSRMKPPAPTPAPAPAKSRPKRR